MDHVCAEPSLTVAIPTYRGARHLAAALRSVLAQEGVTFDLIVSDDRSDDETVAVVEGEAGDRARVVVNSERLGLAGNWNQCVALSRTAFVAIFHQDDVMRPGHLVAHLATFRASERIGLVASAADVIDDLDAPVPESTVGRGGLGSADRTFAPGEALPLMAGGNPLRCSAVTLSKAAHADVGGFDASYRYVVDWNAWLKIARRWGVAWLAHPSVAIRWHIASETHRFKGGTADLDETARLLDELFERSGAAWPNALALRRQADQRLARAFLARSHEALKGGDVTLARSCLVRACRLWPGIVSTIVADPRLAAQMASLAVLPQWAGRLWSRAAAIE
ncbi:MAG: glycosyltransferase [Isosphaeraceae bacterium]|nr:glycosyltransferase [Isosphaeraceae bacterium]